MSYQEYLQSDHWREFRKAYLKHHGIKGCEFCGKKGVLHIHHKTYVRKYKEEADDVVAICESCHKTVHRFCKAHPRITLEFATREVGFRIANKMRLTPIRMAVLPKTKRRKKHRRKRRHRPRRSLVELVQPEYLARDIDAQFQFVSEGI